MMRNIGCVRLVLKHVGITGRESFRVESSSAWLWLALSSPNRSSCWRMNPPATWTAVPAESIFELIARLHRDYQLTSLIATHNLAFRAPVPPGRPLASRAHRKKSCQSHCLHEHRFCGHKA